MAFFENTYQRKGRRFACWLILLPFFFSLFFSTTTVQAKEPEKNSLHALSALLYDAKAGRVLYEKNGYEQMAMASTTKIMTLLITLEQGNLEDIVTISKNAAMQPDVQLNMNTGEQYYLKDLVYSLMLESHNDTAVAIAEHIGGSIEDFATRMNAKARELGALKTKFVTPNGLDAEGHYTTAADLAKIAAYAIQNEMFLAITNTQSHSFSELTTGRGFTVSNKNQFLHMMDGAIGVKTGFTGKAGYCFVGAIKQPDRTLVSVVLASGWPPNKTYKWQDTKRLMQYGLEGFENKHVVETLPELPNASVTDGKSDFVPLCYGKEADALLTETLLLNGSEEITVELEWGKQLQAPVEAGEMVGFLVVQIDDVLYKKLPIQTKIAVAPVDYMFFLEKTIQLFFNRIE